MTHITEERVIGNHADMGGSTTVATRTSLTVTDILRAGVAAGPHARKCLRPSRLGIPKAGQPEKVSRCPVVPRVYLAPPQAVPHLVALFADPRVIGAMRRDVGAELEVEIEAPTTLEFQIAVAPHPNTQVSESLSFVLDGKRVQPLESAVCTVTASINSTLRWAT